MIENGADVNAIAPLQQSALHLAVQWGYTEIVKLLLKNNSDVNAVEPVLNVSVLFQSTRRVPVMLLLICFGAQIDVMSLRESQLLREIESNLLRPYGKRIIISWFTEEERKLMWNVSFCLAKKYHALSNKLYCVIRTFITFNGMFMAPEFDLGKRSIWRLLL